MTNAPTTKTEETLEQRIASAIASPPESSEDLLSILIEVNAAVLDADEESARAREASLNPRNIDGELLYEQADIKMFWANRMHNSLSSIQALYDEAVERERAAKYKNDFDRIHAARDQLVDELKLRYPEIVGELIKLFGRIETVNREIDRIHSEAPEGSGYRLRHVEAAARGLDVQGVVLKDCRLPELRIGVHDEKMAWPLPTGPLSFGMAMQTMQQMFPGNGGTSDPDDPNYEVALGDDGFYTMRRRADAPPLPSEPAPVPMSMREQALAAQAARAVERDRLAAEGREAQKIREFGGG